MIEKKRRDRINNSLAELRRLVPTAFEKQGSAKLEKAEILQMTVDHLKVLHAKGMSACRCSVSVSCVCISLQVQYICIRLQVQCVCICRTA